MELIASATERTTAATDLVLAVAACTAAIVLGRAGPPSVARRVWRVALFCAGAGAAVGALAHGLALTDATRELLWQPLYLLLGATVALFVVGAVASWWGGPVARRILVPMLGVAVLFYLATRMSGGEFVVFVVFQAAALIFALTIYLRLRARGLEGAGLVAAGLAVTLAAGVVQAAESVSIKLVWEFDHNGVYHLVQLAGLFLLVRGLLRVLRPAPVSGL